MPFPRGWLLNRGSTVLNYLSEQAQLQNDVLFITTHIYNIYSVGSPDPANVVIKSEHFHHNNTNHPERSGNEAPPKTEAVATPVKMSGLWKKKRKKPTVY